MLIFAVALFVFMHVFSALKLRRPWLNRKLVWFCDKKVFFGQQASGCSYLLVTVKALC